MEWLWLVAGTAWLVALAALMTTRHLARRLTRLSEQYWELKYEHGELKGRVRAFAPTAEEREAIQAAAPATFVPLSAVSRSKS